MSPKRCCALTSAVVKRELQHHSQQPEDGEEGAQESAQGYAACQLRGKEKTQGAEPQKDQDHIHGMNDEYLAHDRRDFVRFSR